jgi:hypothetical protein
MAEGNVSAAAEANGERREVGETVEGCLMQDGEERDEVNEGQGEEGEVVNKETRCSTAAASNEKSRSSIETDKTGRGDDMVLISRAEMSVVRMMRDDFEKLKDQMTQMVSYIGMLEKRLAAYEGESRHVNEHSAGRPSISYANAVRSHGAPVALTRSAPKTKEINQARQERAEAKEVKDSNAADPWEELMRPAAKAPANLEIRYIRGVRFGRYSVIRERLRAIGIDTRRISCMTWRGDVLEIILPEDMIATVDQIEQKTGRRIIVSAEFNVLRELENQKRYRPKETIAERWKRANEIVIGRLGVNCEAARRAVSHVREALTMWEMDGFQASNIRPVRSDDEGESGVNGSSREVRQAAESQEEHDATEGEDGDGRMGDDEEEEGDGMVEVEADVRDGNGGARLNGGRTEEAMEDGEDVYEMVSEENEGRLAEHYGRSSDDGLVPKSKKTRVASPGSRKNVTRAR